jgi:aspartate aminotransferase
MKISKRGLETQESPIRKLKPYEDEAVKRGIHIYHLNIGQPDIPTPQPVWDAIKNCQDEVISYGPAQGFLDLRQAIADYFSRFNITLEPDNVLITVGGSEAILFSYYAVADIGDEIIIPEPFYTNYNGYASMAGVDINPLTLDVSNGFRLPQSDAIENKITDKTRAIMLCSPNNPTGTVLTDEEISRVVALVKKYDLFLIGDEVYKEFIYDGGIHKSILEYNDIRDRVIVVDSISKRFSSCGARIGAIVTWNKSVYQTVLKFAQARLCPPSLEQTGALAAYRMDPGYFEPVRREYQKRRDILFDELKDVPGIVIDKPQGAFYNITKLPIKDSEHFARWLLTDFQIDNETVMIAPARDFYSTPGKGTSEVRIAYVLKEKDLRRALYLFKAGLERYGKLF